MTNDSSSPKTGLHPVFSVSNIQHKIRVLDGTKVTYASWARLFKLHAREYKVLSNIDGTPSPAKTDASYESWHEVDTHVLQWIYGTLSDELFPRVLEHESTARKAWVRVENIFNNNKGARDAALEYDFNAFRLANMPSLEAYCQRLREIARMLKDVDAPVTDSRLVIQLVSDDSATALAAPAAAAAADTWVEQTPKATTTGPPRQQQHQSG
ncbi:uncharacterized protein LOC141607159 [Silene latifolia]|uniref:uncharacterized protein LOC141607159 n=1 Tax=Silene latifolia TaxID=37657 RepID=UPI003D77854E